MTPEDLKQLLSTPFALYTLMVIGSLISMLKQLSDARKNGATISSIDYLFTIETLIMLGGNTIAFIGLVMTDTLNWTGAIAIGYMVNSAADLSPNGRSKAIVDSIPDSTAVAKPPTEE